MASKVKATLTFVKIFPLINDRREESITIIGADDDDLNTKISPVIGSWVSTETNDEGKILYQCYLKSIEKGNINYSPKFDSTSFDFIPNAEDILNFIVQNRVKLIPTTETWLDENDKPVDVSHDVIIDKTTYQGLTVAQALTVHMNLDEIL